MHTFVKFAHWRDHLDEEFFASHVVRWDHGAIIGVYVRRYRVRYDEHGGKDLHYDEYGYRYRPNNFTPAWLSSNERRWGYDEVHNIGKLTFTIQQAVEAYDDYMVQQAILG
jgi:hypothetical protein